MTMARRRLLALGAYAFGAGLLHRPPPAFAQKLPTCRGEVVRGDWKLVATPEPTITATNGKFVFAQGCTAGSATMAVVRETDPIGKQPVARLRLSAQFEKPKVGGQEFSQPTHLEMVRMFPNGRDTASIGTTWTRTPDGRVLVIANQLSEQDLALLSDTGPVKVALVYQKPGDTGLSVFGITKANLGNRCGASTTVKSGCKSLSGTFSSPSEQN